MRIKVSKGKLTGWQRIFLQSKANGAPYNGDALDQYKWEWPKGTYFQRRLYQTQFFDSAEHTRSQTASNSG